MRVALVLIFATSTALTAARIDLGRELLRFGFLTALIAGLVVFAVSLAIPVLPALAEARMRARVHRVGWAATIARHGLVPTGPALPDPGNPGHVLRLFEVPEGIYALHPIAVLLATNATPNKSGVHASVAITVAPGHPDALSAAAAAAGMTRQDYAAISIRT